VHVALSIEASAHGDQVGMNVEYVGDDLRRGGFRVPGLGGHETDGHKPLRRKYRVCSFAPCELPEKGA